MNKILSEFDRNFLKSLKRKEEKKLHSGAVTLGRTTLKLHDTLQNGISI